MSNYSKAYARSENCRRRRTIQQLHNRLRRLEFLAVTFPANAPLIARRARILAQLQAYEDRKVDLMVERGQYHHYSKSNVPSSSFASGGAQKSSSYIDFLQNSEGHISSSISHLKNVIESFYSDLYKTFVVSPLPDEVNRLFPVSTSRI